MLMKRTAVLVTRFIASIARLRGYEVFFSASCVNRGTTSQRGMAGMIAWNYFLEENTFA